MVINLNKKRVSKEGLLERIQDIDVYRHYLGEDIDLRKSYKTPFRKENDPSLRFYAKNDEILFNDFKVGGDFVKFVQLLFSLNYFEALSKIVTDFNLKYFFDYKEMEKTESTFNMKTSQDRAQLLEKVRGKTLKKRKRAWRGYDMLFWQQFNINKVILEKYNVEPIDYIFFDSNKPPVKADRLAYCFKERKDNKLTFKIYQPQNSKDYKWLNNHDSSVWQGWDQLPENGDTLIITKSLKDVMSIVNTLGIPAVALQSESVLPKEKIIEELKGRFKSIYIFYDNDFDKEVNEGQNYAAKLVEQYKFRNLCIPEAYKSKDFSDLVKLHGVDKAIEIFNQEVYIPF